MPLHLLNVRTDLLHYQRDLILQMLSVLCMPGGCDAHFPV